MEYQIMNVIILLYWLLSLHYYIYNYIKYIVFIQIDNSKLLNNLNLFKNKYLLWDIFPHTTDFEGNFWKHY